MVRQILIGLILAVSLAYVAFTHWPGRVPFFPGNLAKAKSVPAAQSSAPAAPTTPGSQETEKADLDLLYLPTREVRAVDPFALRIGVKRREELPPPPPEDKASGTPATSTAKPVEPKLEGIWVDSGMKVAFISGQALTVGSEILGWRVSGISREQVIMTRGLRTKILRLEGK